MLSKRADIQWPRVIRPTGVSFTTRGNANIGVGESGTDQPGVSGTRGFERQADPRAGDQERRVGETRTATVGDSGTGRRGNANADSG